MRSEWDDFIKASKIPIFMFYRNFMEYHSDRFQDFSLLFYDEGEKLCAVLPASISGDVVISHGGLTFGGFVTDRKMKQERMCEMVSLLHNFLKKEGISRFVYKAVPHIYHLQPAEEDLYALFLEGATLISVEPSTTIKLSDPIKMPKGRKAQISRANREGVQILEKESLDDFEKFIRLENEVLEKYHGVRAVHTGAELKLLKDRFPENIHLITAELDGKLIAGTVLFEYPDVVHTQYMAANETARRIGALDLAIANVIDRYRVFKSWLDFGISSENGGKILNEGLISQKEGFGGRTAVYEKWMLEV